MESKHTATRVDGGLLMASHCAECQLWLDNVKSDVLLKCDSCKGPLDHYLNGVNITPYIEAERERCRRVVADHSLKIRDAVRNAYLDAPMVAGRMLTQMEKDIYEPRA